MGNPNLSAEFQKVADALLKGQKVISKGVLVRPVVFFHTIAYLAAGATTPYQFFKNTSNDGVTSNWANNGLGANQFFAMSRIGFDIEPGRVVASGAYNTTSQAYLTGALGSTIAQPAAILDVENKRRFLRNGRVICKKNAVQLIDTVGLQFFPVGAGPEISGAISAIGGPATNNISANGFGNVNNGMTQPSDIMAFPTPVGVYPSETLDISVTFQAAVPMSTDSSFTAYAFGYLAEVV